MAKNILYYAVMSHIFEICSKSSSDYERQKETMCWYLFYNTGIMLITAIYLRYNYMQPYMIAPQIPLTMKAPKTKTAMLFANW